MAIPVVTVSFTADVQTGVPPLEVQFTDTSTLDIGFKRQWLWDFGDGEISEDQNPTHTYTGTGGEKFTVSLSVVATEGEFDGISSSHLAAGRQSNVKYQSGGWADPDDAWDNRRTVVPGFADAEAEFKVGFNGVQYFYSLNFPVLEYKSTVDTGIPTLIFLSTKVDIDIQDIQGTINAAGFTLVPAVVDVWEVMGPLFGVVSSSPLVDEPLILPESQLGNPPTGHNWGIRTEFRTTIFRQTGTTGFDTLIEDDFIVLGEPPAAAFSALPVIVHSGGVVQFINETVPATFGATTYSWKKRLSGSGDSFEEFSTEENPQETFIK